MKYYIQTFGCQMNVYDTKSLSGLLNEAGYAATESLEEAEIILLNTCAIREGAEERVRGRIGQLKKYKDAGSLKYLGVCGCMGQKEGQRLLSDIPYLDMVMGPGAIGSIVQNIGRLVQGEGQVLNLEGIEDDMETIYPVDNRVEVVYPRFISVMMGCDKKCTFCIVPYTRGAERSRPPYAVLQEAETLVRQGYREITFIGQTINSYHYNDISFSRLLEMLNQIDGLERIRFTTSHPNSATSEMFDTLRSLDKVCENLHLPVQCGSNRILQAMQRNYTREEYMEKIAYFRSLYKDKGVTYRPYISTDIIVGFPGETEEDFEQTVDLMQTVRFDGAFLFKFSPRRGTPAADMPGQVEDEIKARRLDYLIKMQNNIARELSRALIGETVEIMIEREGVDPKRGPVFEGRNRQGRMVKFYDEPGRFSPGDFVDVTITDGTAYSLFGTVNDRQPEICVA